MSARGIPLLVDLYELTMVQAYLREDMQDEAVFSLFVRRLPENRNFLLAAGLDDALEDIEAMRLTPEALDYLAGRPECSPDLTDWLADFRFTGTVRAAPEGTPIFGGEPILEVVGPLPEAQLLETIIMNQVHLQTVLASKAARVVLTADGRSVVDFGLRRIHGSNVLGRTDARRSALPRCGQRRTGSRSASHRGARSRTLLNGRLRVIVLGRSTPCPISIRL